MDDDVHERYLLDAIVTVVDARHGADQLDEHHEAQEQVGFADRILVSKADLAGEAQTQALMQRLRQMNPRAPIRQSHFGNTDLNQLLDTRSFNLDAIVEIEPDFLEDVSHTHDDDVTSFVYRNTTPLDQEKLEAFFSTMVAIYGTSMLRYKGVLNVAGLDRRLVFQGVHMIFGADLGAPWREEEFRETKIVFIGKQLPVDVFKAGLDGCL